MNYRSLLLALCSLCLGQAFVLPLAQGSHRLGPVVRPRRARATAPQMMLGTGMEGQALTSVLGQVGMSSSVLLADYFTTVDGIAKKIGDSPWLQVFIPTVVGMSGGLLIVMSLYFAALPSYDLDEALKRREGK